MLRTVGRQDLSRRALIKTDGLIDMRDQATQMHAAMVLTTPQLAKLSPEELAVQFANAELRLRNARTSCRRAIAVNQLKWLTDQSRILYVSRRQI